jgi:hypothetical protein
MIAVAPRAPSLERAFGIRRVVPAGFALVAIGMVLLAGLDTEDSAWSVVVALVPLACGIAVSSAPLTTLMMSAVPAHRAGSGSAMNSVSRELGGALGVAILGSVLAAQYRDGIAPALRAVAPHAREQVETSPAGALDLAAGLSQVEGSALTAAARDSFVDAFNVAASLTAAVALLVAGVSFRVLRAVGTSDPIGMGAEEMAP